MPNKEINVNTYSRRMFSCGSYKEENSYAKNTRLFFENIIKNYKKYSNDASTDDIRTIFNRLYVPDTFKGPKHVYVKDRIEFGIYCKKIAINLEIFRLKYGLDNLLTKYNYRKLVGRICNEVIIDRDTFIIDLSFYNKEITYYNLYYHKFNCWLYNQTNCISNDALIFVVPDNLYYLIKYNKNNYTINSNYIEAYRAHCAHNPGYQCKTCKVKNCKPRLLNNLKRL